MTVTGDPRKAWGQILGGPEGKVARRRESSRCPASQLHQVLVQLQACEKEQDFASAPIQVSISVQLWRLPGCHEFLAALGRTEHS